MRDAPHLFVAEAAMRAGGMARIRVLHRRLIAVSHPDWIRQVLVGRHERYERSYHYHTSRAIIGRGLLTTDGPYWKVRRRQIQPAFREDVIRRVLPLTVAAVGEAFERWRAERPDGEPTPVVEAMQTLTFDVICRALLSTRVDPREAQAMALAVREGLALVRRKNNSLCPVAWWVPTPGNHVLGALRRRLDDFIGRHLEVRRRAGAEAPDDMAGCILRARDPETGDGLPWESVLDETKTLLAAGFETTATALTWTLHCLSHHPDVARRWHAEIDDVLGDRPPVWEDLERLTYGSQILHEGLRLYPPVYTLGRVCLEADVLGGHPIRPGETLLLSVYGAQRTPAFWPDPERFDPERFGPDRTWPKHAFQPFALGKHQCIGNTFALAEALVILALIGQRFRLVPTVPFNVPTKAQVTLVPAGEIPIRFEPRR
jgi:cytochrome P450